MRYFVIIPSDLEYQVRAVLMANKDDVDYVLEDNKIFISEFEAYRTGIPWLLSIVTPRKCLLRSMYYQFDEQLIHYYNCGYVYNTSSKANMKIISGGYAGVRKINGLLTPRIYTCGNYSISFSSQTREPYVNYHEFPSYEQSIHSFPISVFMNLKKLDNAAETEFCALKEKLKYLVRIW